MSAATRARRRTIEVSGSEDGRLELREVLVTHLAARDAALARRRIERLVDPAQEGAVVGEHGGWIASHRAESEVEPVSDEHAEELKRQRLALLDEIAAIIAAEQTT